MKTIRTTILMLLALGLGACGKQDSMSKEVHSTISGGPWILARTNTNWEKFQISYNLKDLEGCTVIAVYVGQIRTGDEGCLIGAIKPDGTVIKVFVPHIDGQQVEVP